MAWTQTFPSTPDAPAPGPRLLRLPDVLARTGLSRAAVYRMELEGEFPRAVQISKRAIGWHEAVIAEWISSREQRTRPTETAA